MKKSFFGCLLSFVVLVSCNSNNVSLDSSLDSIKAEFAKQDDFSMSISNYFDGKYVTTHDDSIYRINYTIDKAERDYHNAKLLISPDKNHFYFFGFDGSYTMVKDKENADKANMKVYGISINFSSTVALDSLYACFISDETTIYYMITK